MVKLFVESVKKNGLDRPESLKTTPVIVQSFDEPTVRRMAQELPTVPRILLMESFGGGMTDARLRDIKTFATGIGPAKALLEAQPDVVRRAQAAGLTVTAYTFRARNTGRFASVREEMSHSPVHAGHRRGVHGQPRPVPAQIVLLASSARVSRRSNCWDGTAL